MLLFVASCRWTAPGDEPAPSSEWHELKERRPALGTFVEITALGEDRSLLSSAVSAAFSEVGRVESLMSRFSPDSDISRINAAAGVAPVSVDPEVFALLERSVRISELTDGAFDTTVGALSGLWSFDPAAPRRPSVDELAERLPLVGYEKISLEPDGHRAGLAEAGMMIDLGAVAKGYAVDRAVAVLAERGVGMALVNAGGDLRALGPHHDRPWQIGVQDPRHPERLLGWLPLSDRALASSGDYENFVIIEGKRYHHLLDPRTGQPASLCRSVTVIAPEAWLADALSTAVFVLGPERGLAVIEGLSGVEVLIVSADGARLMSSGARGLLRLIEPEDPDSAR